MGQKGTVVVTLQKISEKMSVEAALKAEPARGPGHVDVSREPCHPGMEFKRPTGDLTNYRTPTGSKMFGIQQPPQPMRCCLRARYTQVPPKIVF